MLTQHFMHKTRQTMRKSLFVLFLAVLFALPAKSFCQSAVRGIVYEDLNKNNRRERNEKGIPGVAVSNGTEVTETNSKGEYELPVSSCLPSRIQPSLITTESPRCIRLGCRSTIPFAKAAFLPQEPKSQKALAKRFGAEAYQVHPAQHQSRHTTRNRTKKAENGYQ